MIDSLIKDGYSIKIIDENGSKMLHSGCNGKIAIIVKDSSNMSSYQLTKDYMNKYKEVRVFNKYKES